MMRDGVQQNVEGLDLQGKRGRTVKLCGIPKWINKDLCRPVKAGNLAAGGRVVATAYELVSCTSIWISHQMKQIEKNFNPVGKLFNN